MNEKNVRWIIFALLAVPFFAALCFCDNLYASRDQAKLDQCKFQLKSIARGYRDYKTDHGGAPPNNLMDLKSYVFEQEHAFQCPAGQPSANYDPPFGISSTKYIYDYRLVKSSGGSQVICADSEPHLIRHILFKFQNQSLRNVLYADGRIETVSESDFQSLAPPAKTSSKSRK